MKEIVNRVSKTFKTTRDEAELIIATLLNRPRFELYFNKKLDEETHRVLTIKLLQLKKGVPIEYLTKKIQFLDYNLEIEPGVFIPRLETEYFVELTSRVLKKKPGSILEIGTGCGAIAIALAFLFPESRIIATDISQKALNCARQNIRNYKLQSQIALLRTDIFTGISGGFDLIVSNPPYIPDSRLYALPASVKYFEPLRAINGGYEGLQFIKKLLHNAESYLAQDGLIALEIDEESTTSLKNFVSAYFSKKFSFKKDLFNRYRYFFMGNFKDEKS